MVVGKQIPFVLVAILPIPRFYMRIDEGDVDILVNQALEGSAVVPPARLAASRYTPLPVVIYRAAHIPESGSVVGVRKRAVLERARLAIADQPYIGWPLDMVQSCRGR